MVVTWQPGSFVFASQDGHAKPRRADGVQYRGLALINSGRRNEWAILHVNTGFTLCFLLRALPSKAVEIATEFAECGDWDFSGPNGWQNLEPELMERCLEISERYGAHVDWGDGDAGSAEVAQAVAAARLN